MKAVFRSGDYYDDVQNSASNLGYKLNGLAFLLIRKEPEYAGFSHLGILLESLGKEARVIANKLDSANRPDCDQASAAQAKGASQIPD